MSEYAKKFRGLLIVCLLPRLIEWAYDHDALEEYAALLALAED